MLRFIILRHRADFNEGTDRKDFLTLDVDIPELEAILVRGGRGPMGFDSWQLLGAEVLEPEAEAEHITLQPGHALDLQ